MLPSACEPLKLKGAGLHVQEVNQEVYTTRGGLSSVVKIWGSKGHVVSVYYYIVVIESFLCNVYCLLYIIM